jgi:MFS family permease
MNAEVMQTPQLSISRLLLLGASAIILCVSFLMSVFAPFPLALAVILYGRVKGYLLGLAGLPIIYAFATMMYKDLTLFGFYVGVLIFGISIAEIVIRGISPVKGMVAVGLGFIALFAATTGIVLKTQHLSPEKMIIERINATKDQIADKRAQIEQSSDKDALEVLALLDRPDLLAKNFLATFPSYFFMGVFLMLWFNMFLVLKSRRLLFTGNDYPYSERNLLNFKVPFPFVLLLCLGLVLAVWGKDMGPAILENVGFTIITCLGTFYFFQGFGIFSDLLNFIGIMGIFRTLVVIFVIFTATYLIAAAGLFDNWFDFRKYLVKRKTED